MQAADVDEDQVTHPEPQLNVVDTALLKVRALVPTIREPAVIVGADTTVSLGSRMLNKPADADEARRMLQLLRGKTHQVHTGLVVFHTGTRRGVKDVATIDVPMRSYSDDEIEAYVATQDPLDKAGAYAIQHPRFQPVAEMSGCYAGVVGLPLCHLTRSLRALGIEVRSPVPTRCQAHLQYSCPIFDLVLADTPVSFPI